MSDLRKSRVRIWTTLGLGVALAAGGFTLVSAQQQIDPSLYAGLTWRLIGPFRAGRVNAVTGVPGRPTHFYFGSVGGGVWKTTNAGRTWAPVFDSQPIGSIGAIGVAPSKPDVVYVGTGEADMRSQNSFGNGMYKSTDAGQTWTHIGLDDTRQIGRVIVDPKDPNVVFVAALGHIYGPNPDRGVFRSRDGGATWEKVLYKNENVGAIDLQFDPKNPKIVYAALWNTRRPPWSIYPPSYGPGGGVFKSTDGGTTWKPLTAGLPTEGLGRIGLAVAPTNGRRIYAIVDAKEGGLYRSDDAGATWTKVSGDQRIWGRGWYFCKLAVDPSNPDRVYVLDTSTYRSDDGGKSWTAIKGAPGGDDYQGIWIYPTDPDRLIIASDQGAIVSVDGARTWSSWYNQPTAQIYHVAADSRFPYWATGAQQDSGAVAVASQSHYAEISERDWGPTCAGGEAGYTAPDPLHPDILFGGTVTRCNVVTGETVNVSPERDLPEPARHTWTLPLVFSEADPHVLFFSDQFLFRTDNGGDSWTRISPDLTREDPGVPPNLDEATAADAPKGTRRGVIYTIAPSPLRVQTIWAGTDDGLIHLTMDEGKTWQDVTPPALTPWSKVVDDGGVALRRARGLRRRGPAPPHRQRAPHLPHPRRRQDLAGHHERAGSRRLRADDQGGPRAARPAVRRHRARRLRLVRRRRPLAVAAAQPARGVDARSGRARRRPHRGDARPRLLGAGRHRAAAPDRPTRWRAADVHVFRPAPAIATPPPNEGGTPQPRDEPFAENPPYGAYIDYYLKADAAGPVTLDILDPAGEVIRSYSSDEHPAPVNPDTLNIPAFWRPTPRRAVGGGRHAPLGLGPAADRATAARRARRRLLPRCARRRAGHLHGEADRGRPQLHAADRRQARPARVRHRSAGLQPGPAGTPYGSSVIVEALMPRRSRSGGLYRVHPAVAKAAAVIEVLPKKTGRSIEEWAHLVARGGPAGADARRAWLEREHGLGAQAAAIIVDRAEGRGAEETDRAAYLMAAAEYIEQMYAGDKAALRPAHDALVDLALSLGDDVKICPCPTVVPVYRQNLIARIEPVTATRIDLGLALKNAPGAPPDRFEPTGGLEKGERITHRIPLSSMDEVDEQVAAWLKIAYDLNA